MAQITTSTTETIAACVVRSGITEPTAIVECMARDILSARRDGQYAVLIDLTEFGWTRAQAQRFGSQAHAAAQHANRGELVSEDRHGSADETAVGSDCAARRGGDHVEDDALDVVDGSIVDSVSACRDGHEPSIGETEADGDEMANELAGCRGRILVEKPDHGVSPQTPLREMHGARADETTFVGPTFASHMRRLYGAAADEQVWTGSATAHSGPSGRNDCPGPGSAIARIDSTDPSEIVEAMARDILAARRDGRHAVLIDLTEFGWTRAQAQRFGSQAHAAALDPPIAAALAIPATDDIGGDAA